MSTNLLVLFGKMGLIARGVAVVLLLMSVYCLAVALERLLAYRRAARQSRAFAARASALLAEDRVGEAAAAARAWPHSHVAQVVAAALGEFHRRVRAGRPGADAVEAVRHAAERATLLTTAELKRGTGGLATIGATAPFVGLFGTVIGIVTCFSEMAKAGAGGFAVVAGGVAEALVTTALGLFVALPAVWLYNVMMQKVERFGVEMTNASSELLDKLADLAGGLAAGA